MNRADMISELATNQVYQIITMAREIGTNPLLHSWLYPLLHSALLQNIANMSDEEFKNFYQEEMNVSL